MVFTSESQVPVLQLPNGQGYFGATVVQRQPLCHDIEGWGPLSSLRYDFTPCFLDVWISIVAAGGIVSGAGALWYLLHKCTPQPVKQDWHFYTKLVSALASGPSGG